MITKQEVEKLAKLSKLRFTDEELESFTREMTEIIEFADTINRNVGGLTSEPESARVMEIDDLREDEVRPSYPNEEILFNAENSNGFFVVRRNCTK